ncbi:SusD/RagB family nutrient-binding outer membrane lipoprotein [Niabella sp. CJ426]|uniref:SusD/RagB family nutrient-binding outer membrane lipoprotein n=1 Tax=Niabella sp. CJ426 TaxID=3393740 RepID=UPI003D06E001
MKFLIYSTILFLAVSCSREDFRKVNTNPDNIILTDKDIDVRAIFPNAVLAQQGNDFEAYYDWNRNIKYWSAGWVPVGGMGVVATRFQTPFSASSNPYRLENLYTRETMGVGGACFEMRSLIDKMSADSSQKFKNIRAITYVPQAYSAFYLSDIVGSVAYSDAFRVRYSNDPNALRPKYDTQEALFDTLENQLKAVVAVINSNPTSGQSTLGTYDLYYRGIGDEGKNWAMAANSLRLVIAMRMMERKPAAAKAIVLSVLADPIGPINSRAANWVFKGGPDRANGGNYNLAANISGQKNVVDFMYRNADPRIRNMYRKTALTEAQFTAAKNNGSIPATEVYQEYTGRPASFDAATSNSTRHYFNNFPGATVPYSSEIQAGLFNAAVGQGRVNFPVITYAEVCFMRAELAAKGVTTENAMEWYYKGIDASAGDYDEWGSDAKVFNYTALTPAELTAYKAKPEIIFNPARALEQIYAQQLVHFYRSFNELWAFKKRTDYPFATGYIPAEILTNGGNVVQMPRRWSIAPPQITDFNYANKTAAISQMEQDPEFRALSDITGRVWWDKQ